MEQTNNLRIATKVDTEPPEKFRSHQIPTSSKNVFWFQLVPDRT